MAGVSLVLVALIVVALLFDFLNGLHDAANSIATIVSTRVLRPQYAVFWAAFFNFIAFAFFGLHVANTVGSGIVDAHIVDDRLIFAALSGAIVWNVVTWLLGIPSSSSHALIGGSRRRRPRQGRDGRPWSGRASARPPRPSCCRPCSALSCAILLVILVSWACISGRAGHGGFHLPRAAIPVGLALFARPRRQ